MIVAVHPTRGLDVAATQQVQEWLVGAATTGAAVLLISEDLDEVMQLSDRIARDLRGRDRRHRARAPAPTASRSA